MARRKEIQAVVNDVARSLMSRNNDYQGYWTQGQIYQLAINNDVSDVKINVIDLTMKPYSDKFSGICSVYRRIFERQLKSRKLNWDWVKSINIDYHFVRNEQDHLSNDEIRRYKVDYVLNVSIVSDHGREYRAEFEGLCRPHNSEWEIRRKDY